MKICIYIFFFKQKTAYEMRISDWSSDVCSSDLVSNDASGSSIPQPMMKAISASALGCIARTGLSTPPSAIRMSAKSAPKSGRSEEHTSELQSLMRISYAVFCLKKKINTLPTYSDRVIQQQDQPATNQIQK